MSSPCTLWVVKSDEAVSCLLGKIFATESKVDNFAPRPKMPSYCGYAHSICNPANIQFAAALSGTVGFVFECWTCFSTADVRF